jgi:predicted ATPase
MRALLIEHDAILRNAIDKHGGHMVKHTGDGVVAAFDAAAGAVDAAVGAQERLVGVLPVRIGLHTGEAELRDGDYFGTTLNRCARLMGVAHGGQVVCSEATASLVRDRGDLRDLGEHRLRDLSRPEHVWQVGQGDFPALASLSVVSTNLPMQLSSFVGRRAELADLSEILESDRLVSLVGVGGVGKTRMALELAAERATKCRDGAWLVELAPLSDGSEIPDAVAAALEIRPHAGKSLWQSVLDTVHTRQLLVVFDNCEHLVDAAAELVEQLLGAAPEMSVVTTSREPLGLPGERVVRVGSLDEETARRLFTLRAAEVDDGFSPSGRDEVVIGEICARLDGIALAIELAAARASALPVTEIAERLDQRFRLLTGGRRTAVERHQTLRAAVDWSFTLLDDDERCLLERLSVCRGGFTLAAAESLAPDVEVLDALVSLVSKSLVVFHSGQDGNRYSLLETIRQFAAEKLETDGGADEARRRHAAWMHDVVASEARRLHTTDYLTAVRVLNDELDNLRAAAGWALDAGELEVAHDLLAELRPTVLWNTELEYRLGDLVEPVAVATGSTGLLALAGILAIHTDLGRAETLIQRARANPAAAPNSDTLDVLYAEAALSMWRGEGPNALAQQAKVVALARELDDAFTAGLALGGCSVAALGMDLETAEPFVRQGLSSARALHDPRLLMSALFPAYIECVGRGDPPDDLIREAEAARNRVGNDTSSNWVLTASTVHDPDNASERVIELLEIVTRIVENRDVNLLMLVVPGLAGVLVAADRPAAAAALLGYHGAHPRMLSGGVYQAVWQTLSRGVAHDPSFAADVARGRDLSSDELSALALGELRAAVEAWQ